MNIKKIWQYIKAKLHALAFPKSTDLPELLRNIIIGILFLFFMLNRIHWYRVPDGLDYALLFVAGLVVAYHVYKFIYLFYKERRK